MRIEVPHSTGKPGIRAFSELKGKGNADPLNIDGRDYLPGSLVFRGFVAPPPADLSPGEKTWDGVLRFELGVSTSEARASFNEFVGVRRSKPFIDSTPNDPPTVPEEETDGET